MSEAVVKRAAVVTGGSRGIGRAICVALAKPVSYTHLTLPTNSRV